MSDKRFGLRAPPVGVSPSDRRRPMMVRTDSRR